MVISIVAMLIAILLPALARARDAAQAIACLSNLRQWGIITTLWQHDHNDHFHAYYYRPNAPSSHWLSPDQNDRTWSGMFWSKGYWKNAQLAIDPGFDSDHNHTFMNVDEEISNKPIAGGTASRWNHISYGYNYQNLGSSWRLSPRPNPWYMPAQLQQIRTPSRTIVLADSLNLSHLNSTGNFRGAYRIEDGSAIADIAHARHNGAVNVLWADTHASAVAASEEYDPYSSGLTSRGDNPNYWKRD